MKQIPYLILAYMTCGLFLLASCNKDPQTTTVVDTDLQVYFESFKFEGEKRGLTIDLRTAEIDGYMKTIEDHGVVGQCIHDDEGKSIVIDVNKWRTLDQLEKEFIVFHELGHCYLDRGHTDEKNRNGSCKSMMHSSATACNNTYNSSTRENYLDELFLN